MRVPAPGVCRNRRGVLIGARVGPARTQRAAAMGAHAGQARAGRRVPDDVRFYAARCQSKGKSSRLGLGEQGGDFILANADEIAGHGRMVPAHGANGEDGVDREVTARPGLLAQARRNRAAHGEKSAMSSIVLYQGATKFHDPGCTGRKRMSVGLLTGLPVRAARLNRRIHGTCANNPVNGGMRSSQASSVMGLSL